MVYFSRSLAFLLVVLLGSLAAGQTIDSKDIYQPYEPIVLTLQAPDANLIIWNPRDDHTFLIESEDMKQAYVWANPGTHTIQVSAVTITVGDDKQPKITKKSLIASFKVLGEQPPTPVPPDPPDPPTPTPTTGERHVMIIRETRDSTADQARIITNLRTGDNDKYLREKKHRLWDIDDDSIAASGEPLMAPWLKALGDTPLPALVITDTSSPVKILYKGKLPSSAAEIMTELKKTGG